ncbi:unnamed protein product, partial [Laminaria digitata]
CDSIVATRTRGEISGTTDARRKVLKLCRTQNHNSYQTYSITRGMAAKTVQRSFVSYHGAVVESIREYSQLLVSDILIGNQYAPQTREYDRTSSCLVRQDKPQLPDISVHPCPPCATNRFATQICTQG